MAKTITVDARGDACPIPVIKTKKVLDELKEAAIIQTHVDNEVAVQNVTKLAEHKQLAVSSEKVDDTHYIITMKTDGSIQAEAEEMPVGCIPDRRDDYVVAVGSDLMGQGDDALGKVLIKSFLFAVTQLEKLPDKMVFYNGGAKLTVEGSDSLEDLKSLEAMGVEIVTCGTCLNFYGLTEKLAVGSVSNMYEIVEILTGASKVVRP